MGSELCWSLWAAQVLVFRAGMGISWTGIPIGHVRRGRVASEAVLQGLTQAPRAALLLLPTLFLIRARSPCPSWPPGQAQLLLAACGQSGPNSGVGCLLQRPQKALNPGNFSVQCQGRDADCAAVIPNPN